MPLDATPPPQLWLPPKPAIIRAWENEDFHKANFLPGWTPPPPIGAALSSFDFAFVAHQAATSGDATQTVSGISFGAVAAHPGDTRYLVATGAVTNIGSVSGVTIGGVTASIVCSAAGGTTSLTWIAFAAVPTGTSGNVVITYSDAGEITRCAVYRMINPASSTPVFSTATTGPSGLVTLDLNILAGAGVCATTAGANTGTATWSGVNEHFDVDLATSEWVSGGSDFGVSAGTPRTVRMQSSDTSVTSLCGCAATWR